MNMAASGILRRVALPGAGFLLAAALVLPGLGAPGLWEPTELGIARHAVGLVNGPPGPALPMPTSATLPAFGLRVFGPSEWGARLPGALVALATLGAIALAGASLFGRRAGLLAAAIAGATPLFVLGARQLTSDLPGWLGVALALAGVGRLPRPAGAALAAVGVALAAWHAGLLLGALPLLLGITLAHALHRPLRWAPVVAAGALAAALVVVALLWRQPLGAPSLLLGGVPRGGASPVTFERLVETLGFGLFPFGGVALFAFFALLDTDDEEPAPFGPILLLVTTAAGLGLATWQLHLLGAARLPFVPAIAIATGAWLDRVLAARAPNPLFAFVGLVSVVLVTRDLTQTPAALVSSHLPAPITWPAAVEVAPLVVTVGAAVGLGLVGLLAPPARFASPGIRRAAVTLTFAPPLVLALSLAHRVLPALSPHLSSKAVLDTFRRLAPAGPPLLLYRVSPEQLGVFDPAHTEALSGPDDLARHFAAAPDRYALVARAELARIDTRLGEANRFYAVVDDSSERHVLLAGTLPPGTTDRNPLRAHVWHAAAAASGRPAWASDGATTAAPVLATFGHAIELRGASFPAEAARGGTLPLTLTFHVVAPPPAGQSIFVHLEHGGDPLLNGDHAPVAGTFGTEHWRVGDFIRDQHTITIPRMITSAGVHRVLVGFWPGGDTTVRLPITAGRNDGRDRVPIGSVRIR